MTPTTTRRALLAGSTMLLAGRAAARQATTLRLYSADFETSAEMLAYELPSRTEGRYQIERLIGFDMLEAALGKERADGGELALLAGAQSGELDLVVAVTRSATMSERQMSSCCRSCSAATPMHGPHLTDQLVRKSWASCRRTVWSASLGRKPVSCT
jgi:hypothetical protein